MENLERDIPPWPDVSSEYPESAKIRFFFLQSLPDIDTIHKEPS